jgi:hypothetical protein
MTLIEAILFWAQSLQEWLADQGVMLEFGDSLVDRPKRSCWMNLRRGDREADLVLWETGESELSISHPNKGISQYHYEFLKIDDLIPILIQILRTID